MNLPDDPISVLAAAKRDLRVALRNGQRSHSASERAEASRMLCDRLLRSDVWRAATTVLGFAPMSGEPNIRSVLATTLSAGKKLALPRLRPEGAGYSPVWVKSLECDLVVGAYGILEPSSQCAAVSTNPLDLILVPGVGFDLNLCRLGHGKGHYDRMLVEVTGIRCGVAFDWQVVASVPQESHDIRLDCLATPSRWLGAPV